MKVLDAIKKFFIGLLGIAFFIFALAMTILLLYRNNYGVTEIDNKSLIMINEELASDNYNEGDLLIVKKVKIEKIAVGDEVFAYSVDQNKVAHVNVGIVGETYDDPKAISYENGATFSEEYIIGKTSKIYHTWGLVLSIVLSQWGFLFLILVPGFLIFIYEVYALIVEIKYGEEEA